MDVQLWRILIIEEPWGDPGDWGAIFSSGPDADGAVEASEPGWRCARDMRTAGPPCHFVFVWAEGPSPGVPGGPISLVAETDVPGGTKIERARRLARNRWARESNRKAQENASAEKRRDTAALEKARSQKRRLAGEIGQGEAARSKARRDAGAREPNVCARSQLRRDEGRQAPGAARSQGRMSGPPPP